MGVNFFLQKKPNQGGGEGGLVKDHTFAAFFSAPFPYRLTLRKFWVGTVKKSALYVVSRVSNKLRLSEFFAEWCLIPTVFFQILVLLPLLLPLLEMLSEMQMGQKQGGLRCNRGGCNTNLPPPGSRTGWVTYCSHLFCEPCGRECATQGVCFACQTDLSLTGH